MRKLIAIAILLVASTQANHTGASTTAATPSIPSDSKTYEMIFTNLVKAGEDPQRAACLTFFLELNGRIEQNKLVINENNVEQVVRIIKEENKAVGLLCTHGLTVLIAGFVTFLILFAVLCCACCCFIAQVCGRSNNAVISGSKKAKRSFGPGDKVEIYSPTSRRQITDV